MTREEAREELKAEWEEFISGSGLTGHEKEEADKNPDFKQVYEANMMAIKALEQEPCDDCISRKEALKIMDWGWKKGIYPSNKIAALPPVSPAEKVGRWIRHEGYDSEGVYGTEFSCSECNEWVKLKSEYCPKCGLKMQEVEE